MTAREKISAIQLILEVSPDGDAGPITQKVWDSLVASSKSQPQSSSGPGGFGATADSRSEKNIQTLNPKVQPIAREFISQSNQSLPVGYVVKIISGNRTYAEQDALYAKGRSTPGPIVTNAKGGQSNHNFGVAFDVGIFNGSDYLEDSNLYAKIAPIGKALGLKWGGDWKTIKDEPHYEYNPQGYSVSVMRSLVAQGKDVTV